MFIIWTDAMIMISSISGTSSTCTHKNDTFNKRDTFELIIAQNLAFFSVCFQNYIWNLQGYCCTGEQSTSTVRNLTRQTILRLLLATLDQPAPNLAHFLLGFNLNKPVTKTNLQDPG